MAEQKPVKFRRLAGHLKPKGRAVSAAARAFVAALLDGAADGADGADGAANGADKSRLIENLHKIQDACGCLSAAHLAALAEFMRLPMAAVYEVATFYHHFSVTDDSQPQNGDAPVTVRVCESLSCEMAGARDILNALSEKFGDRVRVIGAPCVGRCAAAPAVVVGQNALEFASADKVFAAINRGDVDAVVPLAESFDAYLKNDGYVVYRECLSAARTAERVIGEIEKSGLRGLGGAGFPVGKKWRIVRGQSGKKIVAVNIDEGEPGTFKDRFYLEKRPHRFLEGALIAAWAVNADEVYVYLRDEYHGCRKMLEKEIAAILQQKQFAVPRIILRRGAGAYICGEESAMIESIEGKRGEPRLRPPFVAEVGVFNRPTLQHNMETLHWIAEILQNGAAWFSQNGRRGRVGFRSFSVSGRVKNPGVHVAPAGITLRELIDEFCGGMADGHQLYGYLPGGASGGILPAAMSDIPLDFDTLQVADENCFIGSAAIIVLSDKDSAKNAAVNMMRFFADESCGQCTPCRVGTVKAAMLMTAKKWDVGLLEELSKAMADSSICGLGQAAPNPIRCVARYFADEIS